MIMETSVFLSECLIDNRKIVVVKAMDRIVNDV
jgi:hypothetical protein